LPAVLADGGSGNGRTSWAWAAEAPESPTAITMNAAQPLIIPRKVSRNFASVFFIASSLLSKDIGSSASCKSQL
jgi:hypothetical protein